MEGFDWLKAARHQDEDADISDKEDDKLKGDCRPGCRVKIYWTTEFGTKVIDNGYVFIAPGMDTQLGDCFVHVPEPQNPGGNDRAEEEFIYMITLMKNPFCTKIICI